MVVSGLILLVGLLGDIQLVALVKLATLARTCLVSFRRPWLFDDHTVR